MHIRNSSLLQEIACWAKFGDNLRGGRKKAGEGTVSAGAHKPHDKAATPRGLMTQFGGVRVEIIGREYPMESQM